jgi:hypothetical protein
MNTMMARSLSVATHPFARNTPAFLPGVSCYELEDEPDLYHRIQLVADENRLQLVLRGLTLPPKNVLHSGI